MGHFPRDFFYYQISRLLLAIQRNYLPFPDLKTSCSFHIYIYSVMTVELCFSRWIKINKTLMDNTLRFRMVCEMSCIWLFSFISGATLGTCFTVTSTSWHVCVCLLLLFRDPQLLGWLWLQ